MSAFTIAAAAPVVAPAKARVSRTAVRGKAAPVRRTVRTSATAEATSASPATSTEVRISDYSKPLVEIDTSVDQPSRFRAPRRQPCAGRDPMRESPGDGFGEIPLPLCH